MDASDVSEQIRAAVETERAEQRAEARFRTRGAIMIAVLAMLLAIASLGGENATKEMINANIHASDNWAFYQAKNIRQTVNQLAADELEVTLLLHGTVLTDEARQEIQRRVERYRATATRYESEPDAKEPANPLKGEGKRELFARARHWEGRRDQAQAQDPNFDFAQAFFQIAIVLGSVAIVATSRWILWLALALGTVAALLMLNGFFLAVPLPLAG
jgi:Domain of unknown function (DUF4337)